MLAHTPTRPFLSILKTHFQPSQRLLVFKLRRVSLVLRRVLPCTEERVGFKKHLAYTVDSIVQQLGNSSAGAIRWIRYTVVAVYGYPGEAKNPTLGRPTLKSTVMELHTNLELFGAPRKPRDV